jgi:hypothetical protein
VCGCIAMPGTLSRLPGETLSMVHNVSTYRSNMYIAYADTKFLGTARRGARSMSRPACWGRSIGQMLIPPTSDVDLCDLLSGLTAHGCGRKRGCGVVDGSRLARLHLHVEPERRYIGWYRLDCCQPPSGLAGEKATNHHGQVMSTRYS